MGYFLDADLLVLGAPEEAFETYDKNIRSEYSFIDTERYRQGRGKILQGFYDREYIYSTQVARDKYETQAKQNLKKN